MGSAVPLMPHTASIMSIQVLMPGNLNFAVLAIYRSRHFFYSDLELIWSFLSFTIAGAIKRPLIPLAIPNQCMMSFE